jgi:transposase InsO family protein
VWAIEKLHIYLYGNRFNSKTKPPARIEQWNLRLLGYEFEAIHTKWSCIPSDRHSSLEERKNTQVEEDVNFLSVNAVPKAMTLQEVQQATAQVKTLQRVAHFVRNSNWKKLDHLPELQLFKKVADDLTVNDESTIVLKGSRIVAPETLREKAVSIAHEGHQGLVKTKQLQKEKVWFPGIDKYVKRVIDICVDCQANSRENCPDSLQMSLLPPAPLHTLNMDFCSPFPSGEYLFVVIDAYSRFPEVDTVSSTSASAIIPKFDRILATHGIPTVMCSDNGPPFTSHEVQQYMEENGIHHRRITPLWPQANSEAERFMQPLNKAIRSAHAEGKQWTKHLYKFLLNFRTTRHATTGFSPSELLFNRKVQNKLPQIPST